MNTGATPAATVCPECGAMLASEARECWLCRHELVDERSTRQALVPSEIAPPATPVGRGGQFSLASLMMAITFVAVLLGVTVQFRGIGIVLAILAAPALVKTALVGRRRKAAGEPLSAGGKALTLVAALCLLIASAVAAGGAFFLTCLGVFIVSDQQRLEDLDKTFAVAIPIASAVALPILFFALRFFWRWKRT